MKYLVLSFLFFTIITAAYAVEQRYMPDGYVREDVIHPYYVKLTSDYFKKVDSGQIKCDYKTYRKEVEIPLEKIIEDLKHNNKKPSF